MGSSKEEADGTINRCGHCREAATLLCYGCYKTPDSEEGHVESVWFCSTKCQKAEWKFHKFDCRKAQARRSLYRVADTAKLAYFRLVERTYDLHIVGMEDQSNTLYIHEGPKERSKSNQFLVQHLNSHQDQQAAMARMNCGRSESYMQVLVEAMLQGQDPVKPYKLSQTTNSGEPLKRYGYTDISQALRSKLQRSKSKRSNTYVGEHTSEQRLP